MPPKGVRDKRRNRGDPPKPSKKPDKKPEAKKKAPGQMTSASKEKSEKKLGRNVAYMTRSEAKHDGSDGEGADPSLQRMASSATLPSKEAVRSSKKPHFKKGKPSKSAKRGKGEQEDDTDDDADDSDGREMNGEEEEVDAESKSVAREIWRKHPEFARLKQMALLAKTARDLSLKLEREAEPVRNTDPHSPYHPGCFVMNT
jgi:hypothetical protein